MQALSLRNISQSHRDATCKLHQVPNNWNQVKKMCELLKDLLKEKNENNSLAIDEIQDRVLSMIDPLFKVWLKLDTAKKLFSSFIFRRDSNSCGANHLFTWSNKQFDCVTSKVQHSFEGVFSSVDKEHAKE